jgi:putative spermidine/putrescine transport system substrate-binding protein
MRSIRCASAIAIAAAAAMMASACGSSSSGSGAAASSSSSSGALNYKGVTLVYATPGAGSFQDAEITAWIEPFEKLTGVKIVTTVEDPAKLQAMVQAGNVSWDLTDSTPYFDAKNCGTIVQKISLTGVSGSFTPGSYTACGAPELYTSMMLMYNTKTYKTNPPTTWADFFDPQKYPGMRVMPDESYGGFFEMAETAAGTPSANLYPIDTNAALKEFDKIKSDSKVTPTGSLEQQLMLNDQADLAIVPSTRAYSILKAGGSNWKIAPAPTPNFYAINELAIPVGAPHSAIDQQFARFVAEPAQQTKICEIVGGCVPANKAATAPKLSGLAAYVNPAAYPSIIVNTAYWNANYARLIAAFENWATS